MKKAFKRKNQSSDIPVKQLKLDTWHKKHPNEDCSSFGQTIKILSWNVNGIRAWVKKNGVLEFINRPELDVICFNETKLQGKHVEDIKSYFGSYPYQYWSCSTKKLGYSGTAILSKVCPISWKEGFNGYLDEGRTITAEFENFFLLATYVPNSMSGKLDYRVNKWDPDLREYIKSLEKSGKGVVWIGDLNVINTDVDVYSLEGNEKCAGGTPAERRSFHETLDTGLVDSFRELYPGIRKYSWFNVMRKAKEKNEGWRFDMAVISRSLVPMLADSLIYDQISGSDHYPIELILNNPKSSK